MTPATAALELKPLGLCFVDPSAEATYRDWRMAQTIAFIRVGAFGALFSWFVSIMAMSQLSPAQFEILGPYMLGVMVPAYAVGSIMTLVRAMRPWLLPVIVGLIWLAGIGSAWMSGRLVDSPGGAVAWGLFTLLFAPLIRIPPAVAIVALLPPLAYLMWILLGFFQSGRIGEVDFFTYAIAPCLAFMVVIMVCAVLERILRRSYVQEQVIARQHEALERGARIIRRYVPAAVAEQISAGREDAINIPQRRRVTILFADIVGFTDIADRVEPEDVTQVLSEYMSTMTDIIQAHGGTLNEFAGDGLMALFGAPQGMPPEDQVCQSVAAALAMQDCMPRLNEGWRKLGLGAELKIRIGINTGMASVGSYGSTGRMTYTAVGLQTNIAARLEAQAKPGEILISEASWELAKGRVTAESRGEISVKGVYFPVRVFAPTAA